MHTGLAAADAQSGLGIGNLLILLLPLLLLVFLMTSQRRRVRTMETFQSSLVEGDEVLTSSGMYGRVVGIGAAEVVLEVAPGVHLRFDKRAIGQRVSPAAPVTGSGDGLTGGPSTGPGATAAPVDEPRQPGEQ